MVTFRDGDSGQSEKDLHDIIIVEVSSFMMDDFPVVVNSSRDQLI